MKRHFTTVLALLVAGCAAAACTNAAAADTQASRFAIGFHSGNAPVGIRYWVTDAVGVDLGAGFTTQTNPGGEEIKLNSVTGNIGVPWAVMTWERASVLLRPGLEYTTADDYTLDFDLNIEKYKVKTLTATAEIEAEIFLAPRVSVSASSGVMYRNIKTDLTDSLTESFVTLTSNDFASLGFHIYLGH